MYCFRCNNIRSSEGSVTRNWGFGPRHFCKACANVAEGMPLVSDVYPSYAAAAKPEVRVMQKPAARQKTSMSAWVRAHKDLPLDELCWLLVAEFPESKPGQNPKLAKSYVNCYLKK